MKTKILPVLLSIILTVTFLPMSVIATEIEGDKYASPEDLTWDNRQTEVTLSFPAAEYKCDCDYDIVFCMDFSTSIANSNIDFAGYAKEMLDSLVEFDANVKVGVIKFKGRAFDILNVTSGGSMSGLIKYTDSSASTIYNAINYDGLLVKLLSAGTNAHGGLEMAQQLLDSDTSVDDDHKFIILLTDGKTFIWNNEEGEAVSNYTQYYKHYAIQNSGAATLSQNAGCMDKSAYPVNSNILQSFLTENNLTLPENFWYKTYSDLYNSESPELSGATKYDMYCAYAYMRGTPSGTVNTYVSTNGSEIFDATAVAYRKVYEFTPNSSWSGITWLEANPFEYVKNDDGTVTFTGELNPDFYQWHPDALMKGLYKAGHLWTEIGEKYNTAVVTYDGWGSGTGLEIAKSFCSWIRTNSDVGTDVSSPTGVKDIFDSIKNQITYQIEYAIDSGIVTDIIPDDFTLVENGTDTFKVKIGTEKLTCISEGNNVWCFGTEREGIYQYRVSFDGETNTILWNINVPVENTKPVSLSYVLEIDRDSANGEYDTNVLAEIEYWHTSFDKTSEGEQYIFEVPKVTYYVPDYTITFKPGNHGKINDGTKDISGTYRLESDYPIVPSTSPDNNFEFDYWIDADGNKVIEFPEKVTADAVYTAVWKQINAEYKVEHYLEQMDGSYVLTDTEYPLTGEIGQTVSASEKNYTNYLYNAEKSTPSGAVILPEIEEGSDTPKILTLKMYYDIVKHTVTFKAGDNGKINGGKEDVTGSYRHGAVYPDVPSPSGDENYKFVHWVDSEENAVTEFPEFVTEDAVYTAVWEVDNPLTGDNINILIWMSTALAFCTLLLMVIYHKKET